MAHYFFDVNDGRSKSIDDTGADMETFEDACRNAVLELAQILRDELPDGERESYVVTVRDANRVPVYVATATMVGEVLPPPGGDD